MDDGFLNRPELAFGAGGDLVGGDHAGEDAGKYEESKGVGTEDHKRFGPCLVAFDIDEPVTKSECEQCEAGRDDDVGTCPQRFVHREKAVPDEADGEEQDTEEENGRDFV